MRRGPAALLALTLLSVLLTGVIAILVRPFDPDKACCDHLYYRSMSYNLFGITRPDLNTPPPGNALVRLYEDLDHPWLSPKNGLNRQPPFAFRVVTPLLARAIALPFGIESAYYLLSFLALAGAALFVGLAIFELAGSLLPAMGGVILFLVNPFVARFNLWDFMLTDPMAFFLAAAAIWALVVRKPTIFFVVCAVGVLNKESMVPMVVAYPLSELWIDRRLRAASVVAALGIGVGWYVFRLVMPIPVDAYSIPDQFQPGLDHSLRVAREGIVLFGVILPAALRRPWGSKLMVCLIPFTVSAVLAAWFVGDLGRVMAQGLTAACVAIFWHWPSDGREKLLTLAVVPLAVVAGLVYAGTRSAPPLALRVPHWRWIIVVLSLAAALAELALWRMQTPSVARHQPARVGG